MREKEGDSEMAARLLYRERDHVPADVQTVYDNVQKATGRVPNMFKESGVPHVSPDDADRRMWWVS